MDAERELARPDAVLWYGPFESRRVGALLPLIAGIILMLVAAESAWDSLRALDCDATTRACTVTRGTPLLVLVHRAETFDPSTIAEVVKRRTSGKTGRDQLLLVTTSGSRLLLAEGSVVSEVHDQVASYFARRPRGALALRAPMTLESWMITALGAVAALTIAGVFLFRGRGAGTRVRVEVAHGEGRVRIDRMTWRGACRVADVPVSDIASVEVELSGRTTGPARVVLRCRVETDVPLLDHAQHGISVHEHFAAELRSELGDGPFGAGGSDRRIPPVPPFES